MSGQLSKANIQYGPGFENSMDPSQMLKTFAILI